MISQQRALARAVAAEHADLGAGIEGQIDVFEHSDAGHASSSVRRSDRCTSATSRVYSHSIVAGGFELMSYTTRLTPRTSLMIRVEIRARTS